MTFNIFPAMRSVARGFEFYFVVYLSMGAWGTSHMAACPCVVCVMFIVCSVYADCMLCVLLDFGFCFFREVIQ